MLELASDVQAVTGARRTEPAGRLRLATSLSFAVSSLTRAIVEFQSRYPRIEVELLTVDRTIDLVDERIDLAVRITNRLDEGVVARQIATCHSVPCASPAYLQRRGAPKRPEDLRTHECITHAFGSRAEYRLRKAGRLTAVAARGSLSSNETSVLREAALAGAGIAMLILAERFGGDVAPWDRVARRAQKLKRPPPQRRPLQSLVLPHARRKADFQKLGCMKSTSAA
ncbi:substrate binding domain-containing protein [Variovorax sp. LARHSF232]